MNLDVTKLEMLGDKVLVRLDPPESVDGSILLSENGREKRSRHGTVLAVGPGKKNKKTHEVIPGSMEVKPGDRIRASYYAEIHGADFEIDGVTYIVTTNDDLYTVEESGK